MSGIKGVMKYDLSGEFELDEINYKKVQNKSKMNLFQM